MASTTEGVSFNQDVVSIILIVVLQIDHLVVTGAGTIILKIAIEYADIVRISKYVNDPGIGSAHVETETLDGDIAGIHDFYDVILGTGIICEDHITRSVHS